MAGASGEGIRLTGAASGVSAANSSRKGGMFVLAANERSQLFVS